MVQFIFLLFGGAIATTSVLGLALLSYITAIGSTSLGFIASCAPSLPEEESPSPQDPSPSPSPTPTPRQS
jgi:hypothetical protein